MFPEPYLSVCRAANAVGEARWFTAFSVELKSCPRPHSAQPQFNGLDFASSNAEEAVSFLRGFSSPGTALALRYVARPAEAGLSASQVKIGILGRANGASEVEARCAGSALCREALAQLGGAFPDYAWDMATTSESFLELWAPFQWTEGQIAEIRRREEFVNLEAISHRPRFGLPDGRLPEARSSAEEAVYVVHP